MRFSPTFLLAAALGLAGCSDSTDPTLALGALSGVVREAGSEAPLEGALVTVGEEEGQSGSDGRFFIDSIPAGTQQLTATLAGYQPQTMTVTIRLADSEEVTVELTPTP